MRKISSNKKREKENLNIEGESMKPEEIEIPVLKNLGSAAGPLIRPRDHYRYSSFCWASNTPKGSL